MDVVVTNARRPAVARAATLDDAGPRDVSFLASDGVQLAGWYVPGRNGAAVIVLHGSRGTRSDTLAHLRMLHIARYGVLAFDARGHGRAQTNALGRSGARDITGAVSFVKRQPAWTPAESPPSGYRWAPRKHFAQPPPAIGPARSSPTVPAPRR